MNEPACAPPSGQAWRATVSQPATSHLPQSVPDWLVSPLVFMMLAIGLRILLIDNPVLLSDEQFYLLVADRMAHGAVPYVDIWDRKPIGLFLIYRLAMALPGDPVVSNRVLGLLSSVATALVIERMARQIAPAPGARMAGVAYLLFQPVFNCAMGQSPVFYNLPVAAAAALTLNAAREAEAPALLRRGVAIMLLLGVAMQIKYTVIFEGIGLGLVLLTRGFADVWSWRKLSGAALLWAGAALLPTVLAFDAYAAMGHGEAFWQANFLSSLAKGADSDEMWGRLAGQIAALTPFGLAIFAVPRIAVPGRADPLAAGDVVTRRVLRWWALCAVAGFFAFGTWYDHYVGPLLVPLSVLAASAMGYDAPKARRLAALLLGVGALGSVIVPTIQRRNHGGADDLRRAVALVQPNLHGRCLYVYEGDPVLYRATGGCIPTAYVFPAHLDTSVEAGALGIDPAAEMQRIMATRPGVVVMGESGAPYLPNLATRQIVQAELAAHYERYAGFTIGRSPYGLYRLRP